MYNFFIFKRPFNPHYAATAFHATVRGAESRASGVLGFSEGVCVASARAHSPADVVLSEVQRSVHDGIMMVCVLPALHGILAVVLCVWVCWERTGCSQNVANNIVF